MSRRLALLRALMPVKVAETRALLTVISRPARTLSSNIWGMWWRVCIKHVSNSRACGSLRRIIAATPSQFSAGDNSYGFQPQDSAYTRHGDPNCNTGSNDDNSDDNSSESSQATASVTILTRCTHQTLTERTVRASRAARVGVAIPETQAPRRVVTSTTAPVIMMVIRTSREYAHSAIPWHPSLSLLASSDLSCTYYHTIIM